MRRQRNLVVLRVGSRFWDRAYVDDEAYFSNLQQLNELLDSACGMADGIEREHHCSSSWTQS